MTSVAEVCFTWLLPIGIGVGIGIVLADDDRQNARDEPAAEEERANTPQNAALAAAGSPSSARESIENSAQAETDEEPEDLEKVLAEIATLEERFEELIRKIERRDDDCSGPDCASFFTPDQSTLDKWARCGQLPVDVPPALLGRSDRWLPDDALAQVEATDDERHELEQALGAFSDSFGVRMTALHERIVGDNASRDRPSHALFTDLRGMQDILDEEGADRRIVALERAGRIERGSREGGPMIEFYRELVGLGDEIEGVAASVLGKERARLLRAHGGSWGARISNIPICRDAEPEVVP